MHDPTPPHPGVVARAQASPGNKVVISFMTHFADLSSWELAQKWVKVRGPARRRWCSGASGRWEAA